jgi:predicted transposase YbfD/YdcC
MKFNTDEGVLFEIGSLYDRFGALQDSRKARGKRYELNTILVLIVLAKLSGEDKPSGIADWAQFRTEELCDLMGLTRRQMPHHSTYRRILGDVIDVQELDELVSDHLTEGKHLGQEVMLSMDGKVLRGSLNDEREGTALLAAYLPEEGVVLLQVEIEGQGKEVPAALKLLKKLDLRGKIVMADALHTQRDASKIIGQAGGDYIWYAKGNQRQMQANIALWFAPRSKPLPGHGQLPITDQTARQVSKGHGRLEVRTLTISHEMRDYLDWPYLEQVFKLERTVAYLKSGVTKTKVIYGFTSLSPDQVTAMQLLKLIRSYWGIENGLHYRRDVTLQEDATRMSNTNLAHSMASINNLVLGLFCQQSRFGFLPAARRYYSANLVEAFGLITRL